MPFTHVGGVVGKAGTIAMQQKIGKLRKRIAELEHVVVERNRRIKQLKDENKKMREAIANAVHVQTVLCADKDAPWCRNECQLHRAESDDCEACDVIEVVQELGIEVDEWTRSS